MDKQTPSNQHRGQMKSQRRSQRTEVIKGCPEAKGAISGLRGRAEAVERWRAHVLGRLRVLSRQQGLDGLSMSHILLVIRLSPSYARTHPSEGHMVEPLQCCCASRVGKLGRQLSVLLPEVLLSAPCHLQQKWTLSRGLQSAESISCTRRGRKPISFCGDTF